MNGLMDSFNLQIQRATNEAIDEHVLPQIQASRRTLNEQTTEREGNVRRERSERHSENAIRHNNRCSSGDEIFFDLNFDENREEARYNHSSNGALIT